MDMVLRWLRWIRRTWALFRESFVLQELEEKLSDAKKVAERLRLEPEATLIREGLDAVHSRVQRNLRGPEHDRARRGWKERLAVLLEMDRFLLGCIVLGSIAAVYTLFRLLSPDVYQPLLEWIKTLFSAAKANAADNQLVVGSGAPFDARLGLRYAILTIISLAFFCALGILAWSEKADVRKIAADMIKTILGVYIGMATKLAD